MGMGPMVPGQGAGVQRVAQINRYRLYRVPENQSRLDLEGHETLMHQRDGFPAPPVLPQPGR